jgi:hypothetical protein
MLTFATLSSATEPLRGGGLQGVTLDCNNSAAIGLLLLSTYSQLFERVRVSKHTSIGIKCDVKTPMDSGGAFACQGSVFRQIVIRYGTDVSPKGIVLTGPGTADTGNTSFQYFDGVDIVHNTGTGLELGDSDSIVIQNVRVTRGAGGTAVGVDLLASASASEGFARANLFFGLQAGAGGLTSRNGTGAARNNVVWGYYKENSAPDPVIEAGSSLYWTTEQGQWSIDKLRLRNNTGGIFGRNAAGSADVELLRINASDQALLAGIWKVIKSAAYTPTNVTTDRSFDADTVTLPELADVVGTMIADQQAAGILG